MLAPGLIIEGKYRIERLLGEGGMGAVYAAEHMRIKRPVAIKVLHDKNPDTDAVRRFEREAEAAGRIGSDHIVEVLDFGTTPEGYRFMVMELLAGESLKDRLKREQTLAPQAIIPLVTQVLEGLSAAHDAGIVHRDLKPDNIFILREKAGRKDFVKIVDFGISKFATLSGGSGGMTRTGTVMGTPYYMSPEQAKSANEVDARSDLYAIGIILYESLTGARPFNAETLTELLFKIVFEDPRPPSALVPSIDPALNTIVMRAFAREPEERFQSAREMQQALQSWAPGVSPASFVCSDARPTQARPAAHGPAPVPAPAAAPQLAYSAAPRHQPAPHTMQSAHHVAQGFTTPSAQPSLSPVNAAAPHRAQVQPGAYSPGAGPVGANGLQDGTLEPQQTWNRPDAAKRGSSGALVAVGALLLAGAAAGSFWWVRGRAPDVASSKSAAADSAAAATSEAPASAVPAPPDVAPTSATSADGVAPSEPTAAPSTSAEAKASASAPVASSTSKSRPAGRQGGTSSAKPSGTVSDFGY